MRVRNSKISNRSKTNSIHGHESLTPPFSPIKVILCMVLTITALIVVTELLEAYFHSSELVEGIVHILTLSGILAPLFYFFWFHPLSKQVAISRASEEEVRNLSHQLMRASEVERRNLARDLHDEFGQKLTFLQVLINDLQQTLLDGKLPSPEICQPLMGLVDDLSTDLRSVLADLRPAILEDLGLAPALESLCAEISDQQTVLSVRFQGSGIKERLHRNLEIVLFRCCQEALTNAIRHAQAHHVEVRLIRSHPKVILTIQDDGVGIKTGAQLKSGRNATRQVGLIGMRERVTSVGGTIFITGRPQEGTRVRIEVPVSLEREGKNDKGAAC